MNDKSKNKISEQMFWNLLDSSPIPYIYVDPKLEILRLNVSFRTSFGYSEEDFSSLDGFWHLAFPSKIDYEWATKTWIQNFQLITTDHKNQTPVEFEINCKDQTKKIVSVNFSILEEESLAPYIIILSDITQIKIQQEKDRRNTQLLEASQSIAKVGGWEVDVDSGELFWTNETYQIHDLDPTKFDPLVDSAIDFYLPDSQTKIKTAIDKAIQDCVGYDLELELNTAKNRQIFVRSTCEVTEFEGKSKKLTGIFQDITDQKQKEALIKNLLNEKEMILKEVHHRIKNNMNTISSLLDMQAHHIQNQEIRTILADAVSRIHSMMVLYDKLYLSKNQNSVSLKEYLPTLLTEIIRIFSSNKSIELVLDIDDLVLTPRYLSPMGIMLNELITNSMKYAFRSRSGGKIFVEAKQSNIGIYFSYSDDGPGYPDFTIIDKSNGFGFTLIRLIAKQLRTDINFREKSGRTEVILEFPCSDLG